MADDDLLPVPPAPPGEQPSVASDPEVAAELAGFDRDDAERQAEAALATAELPGDHAFSFYDRLHARVLEATERHGGKLPEEALKALLLVPDIFILMVRLMLDREVPRKTRAILAGAVAYFILPYDLLPEALLGPVGYLDDLVLAVAILSQLFRGDLEPYARKHWNGPKDLHEVLSDVNATAEALLGRHIYGRLERLLARRGIRLRPAAGEEPQAESKPPAQ